MNKQLRLPLAVLWLVFVDLLIVYFLDFGRLSEKIFLIFSLDLLHTIPFLLIGGFK